MKCLMNDDCKWWLLLQRTKDALFRALSYLPPSAQWQLVDWTPVDRKGDWRQSALDWPRPASPLELAIRHAIDHRFPLGRQSRVSDVVWPARYHVVDLYSPKIYTALEKRLTDWLTDWHLLEWPTILKLFQGTLKVCQRCMVLGVAILGQIQLMAQFITLLHNQGVLSL